MKYVFILLFLIGSTSSQAADWKVGMTLEEFLAHGYSVCDSPDYTPSKRDRYYIFTNCNNGTVISIVGSLGREPTKIGSITIVRHEDYGLVKKAFEKAAHKKLIYISGSLNRGLWSANFTVRLDQEFDGDQAYSRLTFYEKNHPSSIRALSEHYRFR